jgi:hypothetical protein
MKAPEGRQQDANDQGLDRHIERCAVKQSNRPTGPEHRDGKCDIPHYW